MAALTAVRGIGEWSAQIFLMFQLGRPDVLPSATSASAGGRARLRPARPAVRPELLALGEPVAPAPHGGVRAALALAARPARRIAPGRGGEAHTMAENDTTQDDVPTTGGITGPREPTHEATTPPGNQEIDQDKLDSALEDASKPGGGH
jgi:hypothetical protein